MLKDFPSFQEAADSTHPAPSSQQDNGQGEIIQRRIRTIQSQRRLGASDELRHAGNTDHLLTGSHSLDCRVNRIFRHPLRCMRSLVQLEESRVFSLPSSVVRKRPFFYSLQLLHRSWKHRQGASTTRTNLANTTPEDWPDS